MAGKPVKHGNNNYQPRKKPANLSEEEDDDFVDGEDLEPEPNVSNVYLLGSLSPSPEPLCSRILKNGRLLS